MNAPGARDERIAQLEAELDEAQLRSIEARNPGIDMDEVRRLRAGVLSARVTVVRPTREMVGTQDAPVVSAAEASAALDSIAPRRADSQPVRPTRDQIAKTICQAMYHTEGFRHEWEFVIADAILALFGVAVSDSQETPE